MGLKWQKKSNNKVSPWKMYVILFYEKCRQRVETEFTSKLWHTARRNGFGLMATNLFYSIFFIISHVFTKSYGFKLLMFNLNCFVYVKNYFPFFIIRKKGLLEQVKIEKCLCARNYNLVGSVKWLFNLFSFFANNCILFLPCKSGVLY